MRRVRRRGYRDEEWRQGSSFVVGGVLGSYVSGGGFVSGSAVSWGWFQQTYVSRQCEASYNLTS